ncbi:MAG TPA: dockerin type I domain-containing protein, partial [Tepidisphaeraceae bacterium]|nr:dockerin type I domain-containing protein [Tepidisphaeraceae bacterium]
SNALAASINPALDQRGLSRIYGSAVDIGALEAQPPALAGDVNHDGTVNLTDLLMLIRNFGHAVPLYELGDLDGNGNVALSDFLIVSRNFGRTGPTTAIASALASDVAVAYPSSPGIPVASDLRRRRSVGARV